MKLPQSSLKHAALVAFASAVSVTAQAGEVLLRTAGRAFRADVRATEAEMRSMNEGQILALLKNAEIREVPTPSTTISWTESATKVDTGSWTEANTGIESWTESSPK